MHPSRLRNTCLAIFFAFTIRASAAPAPPVCRVASFNLENYIETSGDSRPPKSAASKAKVRESIRALHASVIALQEIGGTNCLLELRQSLQAEGLAYPYWDLITAHDTNIQVAVLSQFPLVSRTPHLSESFLLHGRRFRVSRGFLEVEVQVNSRYRFTLIVAHLKSKRAAPEADETEFRMEEARLLRQLISERLRETPNRNLIIAGDLNDSKDSAPLKTILGRGKTGLIDTRPSESPADAANSPSSPFPPRTVTWTHYYGKEDSYSRIDYLLVSHRLADELDREASRVLALPGWGLASDHRPIVIQFRPFDAR